MSIRRTSPAPGKRAEFCPGAHGGKNWPPIAFSPKTRMIYVPANNNMCGSITGAPTSTYTAGPRVYVGVQQGGASVDRAGRRSLRRSAGVERRHRPEGVDAQLREDRRTGDRCWPPRGGLVFSGGTNDRKIHAFDASTRQAAVGIADQLRHSGAADVVLDRRQAVHRRALRLGRRFARDAGDAQPAVSGRVSGGAGRRRVWVFALE